MRKYVELIYRFKKPFIFIFVLLNVISIVGVTQIELSSDFTIFMPNNSPHNDTLEAMNERFDSSSQLIMMLDYKELDESVMEEISEFRYFIDNFEDFEYVNGINPEDFQDTNVFWESINRLGDNSPVVFEDDTYHFTFVGFPSEGFDRDSINEIKSYLKDNDIDYAISGDIYSETEIIEYILTILLIFPPVALLLVLVVFRSQMKSLKATMMSVLPAGIGTLWTMGLLGFIGEELSIISVLAPVFTIVIGSADGLHFMSHILEVEEEGYKRFDSIVHTLKMVGIPMIITTITSIFGFMSLIFLRTDSIKYLALTASLGIFFAGIATWYVLPLILSTDTKVASKRQGKKITYNFVKKLWGYPSIIISFIILIISIVFLPSIKNEFNMLMIYKDNTEIKENFDRVSKLHGGSIPLYVYVETENRVLDIDYYTKANGLVSELRESHKVAKVNSGYEMLAIANGRLTGNVSYTDNEMDQMIIYNSLNSNINVPISELINLDENVFRLIVFPVDLTNETIDEIETIVNKHNVSGFNVKLTGVQTVMKDLNDIIISNQVTTVMIALIGIFLLLLITVRKIKLAIVSTIPIIITIVALFGFLSLTRISLNVITATMFSISIGVGIDYAVHFSSVFKEMRKKMKTEEALDRTFKYCARPIITNALGLSIGFSILMFSPLQIHLYLSILMWLSMVLSVILSLSLLPTIINIVYKKA
ncbi:MMPL family transporter [Mycoplasmatota bacterium]|nr:MMPL family transporter [Mycoplasmatota bacterium]